MSSESSDALLLLRASVSAKITPTLTPTDNLSTAESLVFPPLPPLTNAPITLPLNTPTRFIKDSQPLELRSIFFAWQQRDTPIPQYIEAAAALNIIHLPFTERLQLVMYLDNVDEVYTSITPLPTSASSGGTTTKPAGPTPTQTRQTDPRLLEIYAYERVLQNRNTQLRGIKPTDFSHVRKHTEDFITRLRTNAPTPHTSLSTRPAAPPAQQRRKRPADPIILLSPSASSLLTMANIKQFLETGVFAPPQLNSGPAPQLLHVSRLLPSVSPVNPMRFVVVDTPEKFKPEYWDRVVAVFTTGQEWQFRGYKWSNPVELFRQTKGFYIGWEGEQVPEAVKKWGTGVQCLKVERAGRWRDREVVEKFWEGVEGWMRVKGWGRS